MFDALSSVWHWLYLIVGGGVWWQMILVPVVVIAVVITKQSWAWGFYTFCAIQLIRILLEPDLRAVLF